MRTARTRSDRSRRTDSASAALERGNLVDPLLVATTRIRRVANREQRLLGDALPDDARTQRHDIRIVVLACLLPRECIVRECAAHAGDLVRGDRDADAGAAHDEPERALVASV